jgi:UDP-N-acetylglucosamine transferase subunit ALG13
VIFVTIGSMFPFDRLIRAMDGWAAANPGEELLAQTGDGAYEPRHMPWVRRLDQADFARTVAGARLVVAHAGMGSVITADQFGKPIVILPRLKEQGEHTTDHQLATAAWLRGKPGIHVADRDADLGPRIGDALEDARGGGTLGPRFAAAASPEFLDRIRQYILS